jgi:MFS family permease
VVASAAACGGDGALLLTQVDLSRGYLAVLAAAFLFNLVAACQDVATDGLAVRILDSRERGLANGIQVGAYRIGMILGGGLLLWVFARTDWSTMFLCMAGLLALTVLPVLSLREPPRAAPADPRGAAEVALDWTRRLRMPGMAAFVALICFYKFGDSMVATLIGPFMRDQGVSKEMIALMKGTVGSIASLAGAALGGWYAFRAGRRRALLACGLLQTASLLFYVAAAFGLGGIAMLWAGNVAEHLLGGMATVALFTLMMDAADPDHAGTDYTLLASTVVLVGSLAGIMAAALADRVGYLVVFVLGTVLAVAGCVFVVWWLDHRPASVRVTEAWRQPASRGAAW